MTHPAEKKFSITDEQIRSVLRASNSDLELVDPGYVAACLSEARARGINTEKTK